MTSCDYLTNGLLAMAIDDELPASEAAVVGSHLSRCEECKQKYRELAMLSSRLETLIGGIATGASYSDRESLKQKLEPQQRSTLATHTPEKILKRFGWAMAIAATLAIGITFAPRTKHAPNNNEPALLQAANTESFEVDGETFVALPYSNADLPLNAPHIVQMPVPVSSLTAAGVAFEPISSEVSAGEDSVLADVLLGIDGQPLGVHVTGVE
jgi:anti-sigma factor RsiW